MVTTPNISVYLSVFPAEIWLLIVEQMAAPDLLSLCCANKTYHRLCVPFLFKLGIEFSQNWRCSCPEPAETWPESKLAFDNCSCRPESPAQWTIRHNHVSTLSAFLHHGLPINAAYKSAWIVLDPCSLLNLAIGYHRTDAVQLLLDNGADVSFSYGVDGHTAQISPLLMASFGQLHFQDTKITRLLLEHGADVHVINPWEISLLTFAIDIDSYAKLLAQGVDINRLNGRGQPNLFERVWYQEGDLVEFILSQNGIDPNIPELQRGWTPLHCAIDMVVTNRRTYHRRTSVLAKLLLKAGASPNIRNYANLTAADYLITHTIAQRIPERVTILKSMIEVGLDYTPRGLGSNSLIHWACRGTHIHGLAFLKPLIENATPEQLNGVNEDGYTALHLATLDNDLKLVRLLIKNGADANLLDGGGRAAIHMAANRHSLMMFVELCKHANPHAVCALGYTALHYVFVNWRDFKKIPRFYDCSGRLMHSRIPKHKDSPEDLARHLLLYNKLDVNAGETESALQLAVWKVQKRLGATQSGSKPPRSERWICAIKVLLSHGADKTRVTPEEQIWLDGACSGLWQSGYQDPSYHLPQPYSDDEEESGEEEKQEDSEDECNMDWEWAPGGPDGQEEVSEEYHFPQPHSDDEADSEDEEG